MLNVDQARIAVIGLGYVGLPLAVEFGKHFPTVGFDINKARIAELQAGKDSSLELNSALPPIRRRWHPVTSISSPFPPPSISTSARTCGP